MLRAKRWIRIRKLDKIQELQRLKMEAWRTMEAQNGGLEAQNGANESLQTSDGRFASL
jgi:hypothetical protein